MISLDSHKVLMSNAEVGNEWLISGIITAPDNLGPDITLQISTIMAIQYSVGLVESLLTKGQVFFPSVNFNL